MPGLAIVIPVLNGVSLWAELRFGAHYVESAGLNLLSKMKLSPRLTVPFAVAVVSRSKLKICTGFSWSSVIRKQTCLIKQAVCFFDAASVLHESGGQLR